MPRGALSLNGNAKSNGQTDPEAAALERLLALQRYPKRRQQLADDLAANEAVDVVWRIVGDGAYEPVQLRGGVLTDHLRKALAAVNDSVRDEMNELARDWHRFHGNRYPGAPTRSWEEYALDRVPGPALRAAWRELCRRPDLLDRPKR